MYYKFLLFDLDHTLFDFDLAEDLALTQLLTEVGVAEIDRYKAVYLPLNKQLWQDLEAGRISKQELVDTRFAKLFAHFGQQVDGRVLAQHYVTCLRQQGQTYPGAAALLLTLKERGYRLYAATNGVTAIQEGRLANSRIGACFEQVFISEQVGFPKPDGRFFGAIAEQIDGFLPETTLMIGDNQIADIQGACAFGLDTVFYNPNHLPLKAGVEPTYTVSTYEELLELLPASVLDEA